jgi:hypothetical protein
LNQVQRFTRNQNFPIFVILLFGLILGFIIFQDFGASWDEPNYYYYGAVTLKAYSDPLAGNVQLYSHYGQPFFIVGAGIHTLLSFIFPHALSIDIWHLTIYLAFLLVIFFFYKLAHRWVGTAAATISTLLFASQPVLFGLSWIDPKDIPFTLFFLGSIYLGLVFSDQARLVFRDQAQTKQYEDISSSPKSSFNTKWKKTASASSIILCGTSLILLIGAGTFRKLIANTILSININNPVSFMDKVFLTFAKGAQKLPRIHYVDKALSIFNHLLAGILAVTILCLIVSICFFWFPQFFKKQYHLLNHFLAELLKSYANYPQKKSFILGFIAASVFLGFATATRTVGSFAALLVVWVWVINLKKKSIPLIIGYGLISLIIFIISWPFLWQNTLGNIIQSVQVTTNFQDIHTVLFGGKFYDSRDLPASYLPTLLVKTLTEPAIILILIGLVAAVYRFVKKEINRSEILVPFVWFFLPFIYVVITTPNIYDNYRQLLFTIPGAFLFSALSIDFVCSKIKSHWINGLVIIAILFQGFLANVQLHPYEYTYYNSIAGGIQGAAHKYEVDLWLTCYKELTQQINANEKGPVVVYVDYNPGLVELYANKNIVVMQTGDTIYNPGSLILLPIRFDHDLLFPEYPLAYSVARQGVDLCVAKRVP